MSRQVLGKRSRSDCRSSPSSSPTGSSTPSIKTRRVTHELQLPSPDPSPCKKRVKIYPVTDIEQNDSSNKENIPPNADFEPLTPRRTPSRQSLRTPPQSPNTPLPSLTLDTMNKSTLHTQVRAVLRPQRNMEQIIGRDHEKACIRDFLMSYLSDESSTDAPTSLYISGAPGTGKSALVNEVLTSISIGNFPEATCVVNTSAHIVYMNCMALGVKKGLTGVWERCAEELRVIKVSKRSIPSKLDWRQRFGNLLRGKKCILVLDEIDHLVASDSTVQSVSQVFAIIAGSETRACLRIIGISNTHTVGNALSLQETRTLHFEPYTASQMRAILSARLAMITNNEPGIARLFPTATLALLTMKIASQTGDIRTVFSLARRSLDLAVAESASLSSLTVTPSHVLAAMKASHASIEPSRQSNTEVVTRVRNLGLHARFALAALLLAIRRVTAGLSIIGCSSNTSGKHKEKIRHPSTNTMTTPDGGPPTIDLTILHGFYSTILSKGSDAAFSGVGRSEFTDLINHLESSGLVQLVTVHCFGPKTHGTKRNGVQGVCVMKGIREEELVRGLAGSPNGENTSNVREEEVKHVWEREVARMDREIRARFKDRVKEPLGDED